MYIYRFKYTEEVNEISGDVFSQSFMLIPCESVEVAIEEIIRYFKKNGVVNGLIPKGFAECKSGVYEQDNKIYRGTYVAQGYVISFDRFEAAKMVIGEYLQIKDPS